MKSTPYQKQHLKSLTGLRFLAALSVFVAHLPSRWSEFDFGTMPLGAAGVGFFYVLSGFILTYVYGSRRNCAVVNVGEPGQDLSRPDADRFSYKKFYIRRFARIWPLHLVTLLISLFFVIGITAFFNGKYPVGKLLVNGSLLQSWIPDYGWIYSLNGPAWSLSVEAFFYAVFPLLVLGGARKFAGKFVLIVGVTIVLLMGLGYFAPTAEGPKNLVSAIIHTNPLIRLFEFATGIGCGFYYLKRRAGCLAATDWRRDTKFELVAVAALILFFGVLYWLGLYAAKPAYGVPAPFWYWIRFSGAAPVFAFLVLTFASTQGLVSRLLACRLMVYLGEISYSFYMIHMGVMLVLARQQWNDGWWVTMGVAGCSFVLSVFLASILYQLVELPCRRWIVGISEGQRIGFVFKTIARSVVDWIRTPWFIPFLILASISGWFVFQNLFNPRSQSLIDTIVASTPAELQGIRFEDDATLLGVRTNPKADGGLVVEMVWELQEGRRTERFVKLLDRDRKPIGRGNSNRALFGVVVSADVVIDRVAIKPDQMNDVQTIAVGFFDRERKAAMVDRGPRSARNRQLHIWELK